MSKGLYYIVYEYPHDTAKRMIYVFNNENSANELVEFLLRHEMMQMRIGVEEHETPA